MIRHLFTIARTPVTRRHLVAILLLTALTGTIAYFLRGDISPPDQPVAPKTPTPNGSDSPGVWIQAGFKYEYPKPDAPNQLPRMIAERSSAYENLSTLPELPFPFALDLSRYCSDAILKHLGRHKNLTTLDLSFTEVTDEGLEHLAGLTNLTSLNLCYTKVSDAGLEHLAGLKKLKWLWLQGTRVVGHGLKPFVGRSDLIINLVGNDKSVVGDKHLEALAEIGMLHCLFPVMSNGSHTRLSNDEDVTHADLERTLVTDKGLKHLARLKNLHTLRLEDSSFYKTRITGEGFVHLAGLEKLKWLFIQDLAITDAGWKHLAHLKSLEELYLYDVEMSSEALTHLARLPNLHTLNTHALRNNSPRRPNDADLEALAAAGLLHKLSNALTADRKRPTGPDEIAYFSLRDSGVTPAGLKHLTGLKNLTTFGIDSYYVTPERAYYFTWFKGLTTLDIDRVTDGTLQHLDRRGLVRLLPQAKGVDNKRATKPEEVVSLSLALQV